VATSWVCLPQLLGASGGGSLGRKGKGASGQLCLQSLGFGCANAITCDHLRLVNIEVGSLETPWGSKVLVLIMWHCGFGISEGCGAPSPCLDNEGT